MAELERSSTPSGSIIERGKHGVLVAAIDQGTSSTRFLVFAAGTGEVLTYHQEEVEQNFPQEGWVEQDPMELLNSVHICIAKAVENLRSLAIAFEDIKAVGIANQRETTIVWDKLTGRPLYNAIVWLDGRTATTVDTILKRTPGQDKDALKSICGLPISTYFSAVKLRWLLDNVPDVITAARENRLLFGTVDSWLLWNLTGGVDGGLHLTDVTNASRTMLLNLHTLKWDPGVCKFFDIPMSILPQIKSSSEIYGYLVSGPLKGVPISGLLGDQQSALVGQMCLSKGQAKNTYGTGCFLLYNTGSQIVWSTHGLLTTVGYQMGPNSPVIYALEGSVAIAGAAVRWLRDNLCLIKRASEVETLAMKAKDTAGVYFVPAFSGLYAPYWRPDARGIICGITQGTSACHLARAALEAVCFQTREILDAMQRDSGITISKLLVDGGMTSNNLLLQLQADIAGVPVVRPSMLETTALGAAMAAGAAEGIAVWDLEALTPFATDLFLPTIGKKEREDRYERWFMAVQRCLGWELLPHNRPKPESERRRYASVSLALFALGAFLTFMIADRIKNRIVSEDLLLDVAKGDGKVSVVESAMVASTAAMAAVHVDSDGAVSSTVVEYPSSAAEYSNSLLSASPLGFSNFSYNSFLFAYETLASEVKMVLATLCAEFRSTANCIVGYASTCYQWSYSLSNWYCSNYHTWADWFWSYHDSITCWFSDARLKFYNNAAFNVSNVYNCAFAYCSGVYRYVSHYTPSYTCVRVCGQQYLSCVSSTLVLGLNRMCTVPRELVMRAFSWMQNLFVYNVGNSDAPVQYCFWTWLCSLAGCLRSTCWSVCSNTVRWWCALILPFLFSSPGSDSSDNKDNNNS